MFNRANFSAARNLFQICLQSAWGPDTEAVSYCREKLSAIQQWVPVDQVYFSGTVTFLLHSVKYKQKLELQKALQFLGDVFHALGDQETATGLFTTALDGFTQMDVHHSRAERMVRLRDILNHKGDPFEAVKLWETARPLFERSSQQKQLANLDSKFAGLDHNKLREVQQETVAYLSCLPEMHAPTEDLERLFGAESPASTVTVRH
jgi:hypothetical protein